MTPEELGLDVTIGIAAIAPIERVIVSVSDRMISFGDYTQAIDNGALKSPTIAEKWGLVWAGYVHEVWPILEKVRQKLEGPRGTNWSSEKVKTAFNEAYAECFQHEFTTRELAKYGYKSVDDFKSKGRQELGDYFHDLLISLSKFSLNAQFVVYGFEDEDDHYPTIFEVDSPGFITDHHQLNYAAVGSGSMMALAALRRRSLEHLSLPQILYRLLEAKFSAETATGVGKTTTVMLHNNYGDMSLLDHRHIEPIREIWKETLRTPDPEPALEFIRELSGVRNVARND